MTYNKFYYFLANSNKINFKYNFLNSIKTELTLYILCTIYMIYLLKFYCYFVKLFQILNFINYFCIIIF